VDWFVVGQFFSYFWSAWVGSFRLAET